MNKPLYNFFTADHQRLEKLLNRACKESGDFDLHSYNEFRIGLLTHIKMEEKILFPAARKANGGEALPMTAQLRLDHGALTALMAVPPTEAVVKAVRHILEVHDELEEKPGGMYDVCEQLTEDQTQDLLKQLKETTPVPVHPPHPSDYVFGAAKRAVARAGYDFDEISR